MPMLAASFFRHIPPGHSFIISGSPSLPPALPRKPSKCRFIITTTAIPIDFFLPAGSFDSIKVFTVFVQRSPPCSPPARTLHLSSRTIADGNGQAARKSAGTFPARFRRRRRRLRRRKINANHPSSVLQFHFSAALLLHLFRQLRVRLRNAVHILEELRRIRALFFAGSSAPPASAAGRPRMRMQMRPLQFRQLASDFTLISLPASRCGRAPARPDWVARIRRPGISPKEVH